MDDQNRLFAGTEGSRTAPSFDADSLWGMLAGGDLRRLGDFEWLLDWIEKAP